MIRRPPRSTLDRSSAASDVYKRQAEKRYDDAVREYRAANVGACSACALPNIARAYDLAGNADSAAAVFERYIDAPKQGERIEFDAIALAGAHKRLGELYA